MRAAAALLACVLAVPAARSAESEGKSRAEINAEIQESYKSALEYYTKGDYSRAILEWEDIIRRDGYQETANKMIRLAHEQIDKRDHDKQEVFFARVDAGEYQQAFLALQALLDRDPLHPLYQKLSKRIERVTEIVTRAGSTRSWIPARTGVAGYVARKDEFQLAYDGLSYAMEINPDDGRFEKLRKLVLAEDPGLAKSRNTTSMKLLEFKQYVALNHIYSGSYHMAVSVLKEIIALEPNDELAHKRLGSAYFAMKMYDEARSAWLRALQIAPGDEQLKVFLSRLKTPAPAPPEPPAAVIEKPDELPPGLEEPDELPFD